MPKRPETRGGYVNPVSKRVPPLNVKAERCPVCAAQPSEQCVTVGWVGRMYSNTPAGQPKANVHPQRRLLAVRRRNAADPS